MEALIDLTDVELKTKLNKAKTYNEIFVVLITMRKKGISINDAVAQLIAIEKDNRIIAELNQLLSMNKGVEIRYSLNFLTEEEQIKAVNNNASLVMYIINPTILVILTALRRNRDLYKYFSEDVKEDINDYSEDIQLKIIKNNPELIKIINNPSNEFLIKATETNELIITNILNPTEEVQLAIVDKDASLIKYIVNPSVKVQIEALKRNPNIFKLIKNPTEEVQLFATKQNGSLIRHIKNPSIAVQLEAIKRDYNAIRFINSPTEEVQLFAVRQNGCSLEYIPNPSSTVQVEALKQDFNAIKFISSKNLTEEVQLSVVKQNGFLIQYIQNPSIAVQLEALKQDFNVIEVIGDPTEEMKLAAVKHNGSLIQYIQNPSIAMQIEALRQDVKAIKFISNPSEELQLFVVKQNCLLIQYIENPSNTVQFEALKQDYNCIKFINSVSETCQDFIVRRNGLNIQYITRPSVDIQMIAVEQNGCAIQYIEYPSIPVQLKAVETDSMAIRYIRNPSEQVMLESVKNDPMSIQYMDELPMVIQIEAVKSEGEAIKFIQNSKIEVQLEAVRNSGYAILYIADPLLEVQLESIKYFPESIIFIKDPQKESLDLYTKLKPMPQPAVITVSEGEALKSYYESILENTSDNPDKSYIINWKDDLSKHINCICETIAIKYLNIAIGFAFKSGLDLIKDSFNAVVKNKGVVRAIVGSLQKYDEDNKVNILGMDANTAIYINKLLINGVMLRTFQENFYHGKYYWLEGESFTCVIIGSSNISSSGFKANRELNMLYVFDKSSSKYEEFKGWFDSFWNECISINRLDPQCFSNFETEYNPISSLKITKIEENYLKRKLLSLSDEEVKLRFNIWLSKNPNNIYTDLGINSLQNYLLFEYKDFNLMIFESFDPGNGYYYFYNQEMHSLISLLQQATKSEIFSLSQMHKRGYHIKNSTNLEMAITNLFIKKYKG